jgi:hypothetical protein
MNKDNRYITLIGTPLHKPLWQHFHQAASFTAPVLSIGLAVSIDQLFMRGHNTTALLTQNAPYVPIVAFAQLVGNAFTVVRSFGAKAKDLCIDKAPTNFTPPTSEQRLTQAFKARKSASLWFGLNCVGLGLAFCAAAKGNSAATLTNATNDLVLWTPFIAGNFSTMMRFNNVLNGKSVIADAPPRKLVQKVESGFFSRLGRQVAPANNP